MAKKYDKTTLKTILTTVRNNFSKTYPEIADILNTAGHTKLNGTSFSKSDVAQMVSRNRRFFTVKSKRNKNPETTTTYLTTTKEATVTVDATTKALVDLILQSKFSDSTKLTFIQKVVGF